MSGHNKWSQIKRQKEAGDAKKSQLFGKLSRLISTNVKLAHGNRNAPSVRAVIEKARGVNMPIDTIERAIKKAIDAKQLESITYEAYGPEGVGIIIETLTENKNKSAQEVKHILSKNGFGLASIGAVTWAFRKQDGLWHAEQYIDLTDEAISKLESLVDELESNDAVQEVITNAN